MTKENIDNALGLTSDLPDITNTDIKLLEPVSPSNVIEYKEKEIQEPDPEFEEVRNTYQDVIADGKTAIGDIITLAGQSQSARSYEVAAIMMRAVIEANKQLGDLYERKRDAEILEEKAKQPETVTNNLNFHGTTAEFQELLKSLKEEKNGK